MSQISTKWIAGQAITNSLLAPMPTLTLKGNNTGGSTTPLDLTVAQVNLILPVFTSTLNGLTPLSGGGTTNFLRADGTWANPSAGSGANTALSNLTTTAVNISVNPGTTDSITLGSSSKVYSDIWVGSQTGLGLHLTFGILEYAQVKANITTITGVPNISGVIGAGSGTLNAGLGLITISSSVSDANATGGLYLETGNKTAGTGASGTFKVQTGTSAGGASGGIVLQTGTGTTRGQIKFVDGTQGTANQVWTSADTLGNGKWAAVPTPTGTASTVAYFNASGNLTGDSTFTFNANGSITVGSGAMSVSTAIGAMVRGYATNDTMVASGPGSMVSGYLNNGAAGTFPNAMAATAIGSHVFGAANDGQMYATNIGSIAMGTAYAGSSGTPILQSTGVGSIAMGEAVSNGVMTSSGNGSIAMGQSNGNNASGTLISSSGNGSLAGGYAFATANVQTSGDGSISYGQDLNTSGQFSQAFGIGHITNTYLTTVVGRYSEATTSNPSTFTSTDPLFVVANGASTGSRKNAFKITKDGTLYIKDSTIGSASVGYVWTLANTTTGQGGWAAAGSGANTALSNLASVAVNADLNPGSNNARNIGSQSLQYLSAAQLRTYSYFSPDWLVTGLMTGLISGYTGVGVVNAGIQAFGLAQGTTYFGTGPDATANAIATGSVSLLTGNKTAGTGNSGAVNILTGSSSGGVPGAINITAGNSTGTTGFNASGVTITSGSATGATGAQAAGQIVLQGGTSTSTSGGFFGFTSSGSGYSLSNISIVIQGGTQSNASGSVTGGGVAIAGGNTATTAGGNPAGIVDIRGGYATAASSSTNGGAVNIQGGAVTGATSTGAGGAVNIIGGAGGTSSGNGGGVLIQTGAGTARGKIQLKDGTEGTAGWVWTSTDTVGSGSWQAVASSGANTTLSNLGTTSLNANLLPSATNTRKLGTELTNQFLSASALRWWSGFSPDVLMMGLLTGAGNGLGVTGVGISNIGLASFATALNPLYVITADDAVNNALATGQITVQTGSKTAGTGNSGDFVVAIGTSSGGTRGKFRIQDGSQGTSGQVWTSNDTTGGGHWAAAGGGGANTALSNLASVQINTDLTFAQGASRNLNISTSTTGAGNALTIKAGGALAGGSNSSGGNLTLSTGQGTGSGGSAFSIQMGNATTSGTSAQTMYTPWALTQLSNGWEMDFTPADSSAIYSMFYQNGSFAFIGNFVSTATTQQAFQIAAAGNQGVGGSGAGLQLQGGQAQATTGSGVGGVVQIFGGNSNSSTPGAWATISVDGNSTSQASVQIAGGQQGSSSANRAGGDVVIQGGATSSTTAGSNGGQAWLAGGMAGNTPSAPGNGGAVNVFGGANNSLGGSGSGGAVNIRGGVVTGGGSSTGFGGSINILTPTMGTNNLGSSGSINITVGNTATGTGSNGPGQMLLTGGSVANTTGAHASVSPQGQYTVTNTSIFIAAGAQNNSTSSVPAGAFVIAAGATNSTASGAIGGQIDIRAGYSNAASSAAAGGSINIQGGNVTGTSSSSNGGSITITSGNNGATTGTGTSGAILITTPTPTAAVVAGNITLQPGGTGATSGRILLSGPVQLPATNTPSGTNGAQTINKPSGTVNIAAAGTSVVVTNNLVTTSSLVFCQFRTLDASSSFIKAVVPAAGSFTITLSAAVTAAVSIGFMVINQ